MEATTATEKREMMWTASGKRAKATSDEKRVRILNHMIETGVKAASELANELDLPVSTCSYHLQKLVQYDCIELVKTEVVRGGLKKSYRAIDTDFISGPDWQGMEDSQKPQTLTRIMASILGDFDDALVKDTFGDDGLWHMVRNPLKSLDRQGLVDLIAAHMDLYHRSNEIQREAAERMRESGEDGLRISSSSQCFRVGSFDRARKVAS